ncbi:MAG: HesA/MoeB/ThiF family protein [Armatimonadetes bacterium]|nr:HesA/MoeB/ThiF family protein [Armatimonadota bacterium]
MLTEHQLARYERQILFRPLGAPGQARLLDSRVVVCGCGAIGAATAEMLARAGVGYIRLVDFDCLELSNLQRQTLYEEGDLQTRPKCEIAAERLSRINSEIVIEPVIAKIGADNAAQLVEGVDVIVDGVDNFAAKFAMNQAAITLGIPMVYAALSGSYGLTMAVRPGETACLCCLYCAEPDKASSETAATAGVIGPSVNTVASLQMSQVLQLLTGQPECLPQGLLQVEVWDYELRTIRVPRRADCAVCGA